MSLWLNCTQKQALATADFIWEFRKKKTLRTNLPGSPRAEMKMKELTMPVWVEVYNNPISWNNRQMQKVYDAFVDIWGVTEKLWVTHWPDQPNFPLRFGFWIQGFIHWDYDPETKPQNVRGVFGACRSNRWKWVAFNAFKLFRNYDTWKLLQYR